MFYPTLQPILLLILIVALCSGPIAAQVWPIEVLVTILKDKVVALPGGGSPAEEALGVNETIVTTAAKGPADFPPTLGVLLWITPMDRGAVGDGGTC